MANIAEVGFKSETSGLERAVDKLDDLNAAAKKTQTATEKLGLTAKQASNDNDKLAKSAGRARDEFGRFIPQAKKATDQLFQFQKGAGLLDGVLGKVGGTLRNFATGIQGLIAGAVAGLGFQQLIDGARTLSQATGELATNVDAGSGDLEKFTGKARELADMFGTTAADQVKTFYDAVSAGATSVKAATDIVTTGNKLAIGGLTNNATAIDVLTTATNAYASVGLTAEQASDSMFIAMKAGKTTIGQLASQMGNVIPIASSLGVSFDEVNSAVAALTLQGQKTETAVTGVRGILAAVLKPSSEATKLAKALGLEFNSASLKAKGFAGFLADVIAKTKGNADALALLFGGVEAIQPALALAGPAARDFANILDDMGNKAGATDAAYKTIAETLDFRLKAAFAQISNAAVDVGGRMLNVFTPFVEGIAAIVRGTSPLIPILQQVGIYVGIAFAPAILHLFTASIVSLIAFISTGLVSAIYAATGAMYALALANPFTAIITAITLTLTALYYFRNEIRKALGPDISAAAEAGAQSIYERHTWAFNNIETLWAKFPSVVAAAGVGAANAVISAVDQMYSYAVGKINALVGVVNRALAAMSAGISIPTIKFEGLGGKQAFQNDFANDVKNAVKDANIAKELSEGVMHQVGIAQKDITKSYRQMFSSSIAEAAAAIPPVELPGITVNNNGGGAGNFTMPKLDGGGGGKGKKAGGGGKSDGDTYADIVADAQKRIATLQAERDAIGLNEFAAAKLRYETELLNKAKEKDIALSPQQRAELMQLAGSMATLEAETKQAKEALDFARETTKSFVSDLRQGLKSGEGFWASFKNAASNALDKIIDKLLNNFIDAIFQANSAAGGLGGGGGGGILGGIFKLFGFAKGGAFGGANDNGPVQRFAKGGEFTNKVVGSRTMFSFAKGTKLGEMGERGPEAVMPLRRGPDGSLGVQMYDTKAGRGGGGATVHGGNITNVYQMSGVVSEQRVVEYIEQAAERTLQTARKNLANDIDTYNRDGMLA